MMFRREADLFEGRTSETEALVRLQDAQLDEADHGGLLHAAVRLLGAVGHQLGEQDALLRGGVLLLQLPDSLGPRRQQGHQHTLAGRCLQADNKAV